MSGEYHAIEAIRRQAVVLGDVRDECRLPVCGIDVQDLALGHFGVAEPLRVTPVLDLQYSAWYRVECLSRKDSM